ncbi:MAG: response regulator, partial [Ignavibacteriales bacterium]|nr:response regulator [Ignavibacteriales bacterium]
MSPQKEKTVLLVEDDAIIALASAQTIRRFGYEVIIAHSGEKAIELVNEEELIDLILMDIDLGNGISGPEAASHILEYRSIPIVFLTSHAEREMVDKVRGITRYGYVIKNAGDFVLQSSIEMAFELFDANEKTKNELSERKRTEEVLKSSLALLEATLESTDNGILVVSTEGRVLKVNGRFSEMWRIPDDILDSGEDEELLNHILNQLSDPEEFLAKVRKLYDERAAESFDLVHFKDGRTFERISKPMLVGEEPKGRAWSFSDITERKRA